MSGRIADVNEALADHASESFQRAAGISERLTAHVHEDGQIHQRLTADMATLKSDVTKIRHRLSFVAGAWWAIVFLFSAAGIGLVTVGKFAAEKWVREISDRAVEAAIMSERWRKAP
jgi:hypothetical protein